MTLKTLLFFSLFSVPAIVLAQHCPFDNAFISVIRVIDQDSQSVDGLKIYMLDSQGKVVKHYQDINDSYEKDTFFFHKNPDSTTFKGYIDNNHPFYPGKFRFWFAEDNYVILNGILDTTHTLCITDPSGRFETKKVSILQLGNFPLCTGMSNWNDDPDTRSFFPGYTPLVVRLEEGD